MKKNIENEEYSIATLLKRLSNDEIEKRMIEFFSQNVEEEQMLQELVKMIRSKKT
jgi:hypothetical protein